MRGLFVIFALLLPYTLFSQECENKIKFNAGFKVGFHASTYNKTDFEIDGYEFNEAIIQSNKIGYSASPFVRVSMNSFICKLKLC